MKSFEMKLSNGHSNSTEHGRFPERLFTMLEKIDSEGMSNIISWDESGECVIVKNRQALEESGLLQKYMLQNKYTSFNRQMQYYGFKRVDDTNRTRITKKSPIEPIFMHPSFQRIRPDLYEEMVTLRPPSNKKKTSPTSNASKKRKTEEETVPVNNEEAKKPKAKKAKRSRRRSRTSKKSRRTDACTSPVSAVTDYFDEIPVIDMGFGDDYTSTNYDCTDISNKIKKENFGTMDYTKYTSDPCPCDSMVKKGEEYDEFQFTFVDEVELEKGEDNNYNYLLQEPLPYDHDQNDCCRVVSDYIDEMHKISDDRSDTKTENRVHQQENQEALLSFSACDVDCITAVSDVTSIDATDNMGAECHHQTTNLNHYGLQAMNHEINTPNTYQESAPNHLGDWYDIDETLKSNDVQPTYWV